MMEIKFHGQSCFELSEGGTTLLVDPFLKPNNPAAVATAEEVEPTHIAISHGHADHMADVGPGRQADRRRTAWRSSSSPTGSKGRGSRTSATPTSAARSSSTGARSSWSPPGTRTRSPAPKRRRSAPSTGSRSAPPAGLVIKIGGKTVYHAGDTCLFGDMKLIAERNPVDVALLPIGGHYTMDRHDAVVAAEFVGAGTVIPMHYDTFPPIETDAAAFKADVEAQTSSQVVLLKPGETHTRLENWLAGQSAASLARTAAAEPRRAEDGGQRGNRDPVAGPSAPTSRRPPTRP